MKRLILTLVLLLLAASAFAQDTATNNMLLAGPGSAPFTTRLQYLMFKQARAVLAEAATDASHSGADTGVNALDLNYDALCHKARYQYAGVVKDNPATSASLAAVLISSSNFADSVVVNTISGNAAVGYDSSISDAGLLLAVKHQWNTLSKCVTNP